MKKTCFLLLILFAFSSCVTREEVQAVIFKNNFHAKELKELCKTDPILPQIGFYRVLNDGKKEFLSICNEHAKEMLAVHEKDFNELLDRALPKPKEDFDQ